MSGWVHSWDGTDASEVYYAKHTVELQDTADTITYTIGDKTQFCLDVYEFERMCHELAKFGYVVWPENE